MGISKVVLALGLMFSAKSFAVTFDSDVPKNIQDQMVQDLAFIGQIQGSAQTKFHSQIFGAVSGTNYSNFFQTHIDSVGLNSCGGGAAVACVMPMFGKKMWLTQNFIKFSHPAVARAMVVFHEARHTEGNNGNWAHDDCPVPFKDAAGKDMTSIWTGARLEGQPACDKTPYGSYGSSTIMLKNISKFCTNCNEKVKMDADIYSADQLGRINNAQVKQSMIDDFNGKL